MWLLFLAGMLLSSSHAQTEIPEREFPVIHSFLVSEPLTDREIQILEAGLTRGLPPHSLFLDQSYHAEIPRISWPLYDDLVVAWHRIRTPGKKFDLFEVIAEIRREQPWRAVGLDSVVEQIHRNGRIAQDRTSE